jgi:hypothetical protein
MKPKIDKSFFIDRAGEFAIIIPVVGGIVQEFNDHEYKGKLSSKTVGKHINVLKEICEKQLYNTRVGNYKLIEVYTTTKSKNLEWTIVKLKERAKELGVAIKSIEDKKEEYLKLNPKNNYNYETRLKANLLDKSQTINLLALTEIDFEKAKKEVAEVKSQIFKEHGIQY